MGIRRTHECTSTWLHINISNREKDGVAIELAINDSIYIYIYYAVHMWSYKYVIYETYVSIPNIGRKGVKVCQRAELTTITNVKNDINTQY